MKKTGLWTLVLSLGMLIFADDAKNPPGDKDYKLPEPSLQKASWSDYFSGSEPSPPSEPTMPSAPSDPCEDASSAWDNYYDDMEEYNDDLKRYEQAYESYENRLERYNEKVSEAQEKADDQNETYKDIYDNEYEKYLASAGCFMLSMPLGKNHPSTFIPGCSLQIYEEALSSALYTPVSLSLVSGWSVDAVSFDRTEAGAPRSVSMFDMRGRPIRFTFEDDESIGLPDDHLLEERRFARLFMVDAEGWATLAEPAYYDLYPGTGERYRFYAHTNSTHYLELCSYQTPTGRQEDFGDMGIHIVRDEAGNLRQVKTAGKLADIITDSLSSYHIDVFAVADVTGTNQFGIYQTVVGAQPVQIWGVGNPDPGSMTRIRTYEIKSGVTNVCNWTYTADAEQWEVEMGDGLRYESRDSMWDDSYSAKLETHIVKPSSGSSVIEQEKTVRQDTFDWGRAVTSVKTTVDPGISAETLDQTFEYYQDTGSPGEYGQLKKKVQPDGSWINYDYTTDGKKQTVTAPLGNSGDAASSGIRRIHYEYTPQHPGDLLGENDHRPRKITFTEISSGETEEVQTLIVLKAFITNALGDFADIEERTTNATAQFGDAGNLRTEKTYYGTNSAPYLAGRLKSYAYPDGTMEMFSYEFGNWITNSDPTLCAFIPSENGTSWREIRTVGTVESPAGITNKTLRYTLVYNEMGARVLSERYVYTGGTGYQRIWWLVEQRDSEGHTVEAWYSDGTQESATWGAGCCGKQSEVSAAGTETAYSYDTLGRLSDAVRLGSSDVTKQYTYDARGNVLSKEISAAGLSLVASNSYDGAGRQTKQVAYSGLESTWDYPEGDKVAAITLPGGTERIVENYLDGRAQSITGSAGVPSFFEHGINPDGTKWELQRIGGTNAPMWIKATKDGFRRISKIEKPSPTGSGLWTQRNHYNNKGQLIRMEQSGLADTLYEYDQLGRVFRSGLDMDGNGTLDLAGTDRVQETDRFYEQDASNNWWRVEISKLYAQDNSASVTTVSVQKVRYTGLGESFPNLGKLATESISMDLLGNETTSKTYVDRNTKTVTQITDVPYSTNNIVSITVDGLLRFRTTQTGLTYTYQYDALGRMTGITDPRTGQAILHYDSHGRVNWVQDAASNRTSYAYDLETGRKIAETNALGYTTFYAYNDWGQVTNLSGTAIYPSAYVYDDFGRRTELHTWRDASGNPDITRWLYDQASGELTNKFYADGRGTSYTYNEAGQLSEREWARGIVTMYSYDFAGSLTNTVYSDSTPSISITYDRLGRKTQVTDASGTNTFAYDSGTLVLTNETQLASFSINRSYDDLGRFSGISLGDDYVVSYGYDELGRLSQVSSFEFQTDYSYLPDSDLLAGYTNNFGFAVEYGFEEHRNLKTEVLNQFGTNTVSSFDYLYDEIGRRTQRIDTTTGVVANDFAYNARSELTNALMGAGSFAWTFDDIGNRLTTSTNLTISTYQANNLNQYTNIINGITNTPMYDLDGNMTSYNGWTFKWNGENRLIQASNATTVVVFAYDYMGRRIKKTVNATNTTQFVYDGWAMIHEESSAATNSYVYGLDLSGSIQAAGTIGGLLSASLATSTQQQTTVFYCYDANGNVTDLVDTNGATVAHYEYGPFAEIAVQNGMLAEDNPFCFSTKYFDTETGLSYYGLRYYSAQLGRWLSKDPIGEFGSINLYIFCANNAVLWQDYLGADLILGNTDVVGGLHQKVNAGDYGQSFGSTSGWGSGSGSQSGSSTPGPNSNNSGDGIVYKDPDEFSKIVERVKTTPEEDKWLQEQMKKELDQHGNYNLFLNNCRHYSQDLFERMKAALEEKRKEDAANAPPLTQKGWEDQRRDCD